jgi:hypothetical protein
MSLLSRACGTFSAETSSYVHCSTISGSEPHNPCVTHVGRFSTTVWGSHCIFALAVLPFTTLRIGCSVGVPYSPGFLSQIGFRDISDEGLAPVALAF